MQITIWSDFMCPFCYIGESHLYQALDGFEHKEQVDVEYKSYLLSPDAEHDPNKDYYETFADLKNTTVDQAKAMFTNVINMADNAGLVIDYDTAKYASTIPAHKVFQYAKEQGKGNKFFKRFYRAHFSEGELLSDEATIVRLASELDIDEAAVKASLENEGYEDRMNRDIAEAGQVGVQGVPFYVFNNKYAVSGAQPVEQFKQVLQKVWEEENK